jgi:hypothetical protein
MSSVSGPSAAPSRRYILAALAGIPAFAQKSRTVPSAIFRYSDPSTEFPVIRLTDPMCFSRLPAHYGRSLARRGNYMLYASDVNGRMDAYRMDLKSGVSHQLTEVDGLDPASLTFTADVREICCLAGGFWLMWGIRARAKSIACRMDSREELG